MASLWKREQSSFWTGCFTDADGNQVKKTTKKRDRNEAMALCLEWERSARLAREGNLSEAQTRKILADILEKCSGEKLDTSTVRQFLESWVTSKSMVKATGTSRRYRHTVDAFLKFLKHRADTNLQSLRPNELEAFRDLQIKDGKSPVTANMVIKTLRVPLNAARRQGLILTNPAEAVEMLPAESSSKDVFSPEQIQKLIKESDGEWKGLILIARYCGLRLGDARGLTWENIHLDGDQMVLRFYPQKARRGAIRREHEIPVHPKVQEFLLRLPIKSRKANAPILPALSQIRLSGCNGLSAQFQKIMAKAGIFSKEDNRKLTGKGRRFNNLTFHSLRHTFVSRLANAGVTKELRMKLSGHTSEVHQRYTHHEMNALKKAMLQAPNDE